MVKGNHTLAWRYREKFLIAILILLAITSVLMPIYSQRNTEQTILDKVEHIIRNMEHRLQQSQQNNIYDIKRNSMTNSQQQNDKMQRIITNTQQQHKAIQHIADQIQHAHTHAHDIEDQIQHAHTHAHDIEDQIQHAHTHAHDIEDQIQHAHTHNIAEQDAQDTHNISNDIRNGMKRAFQAYMRDAWKSDEYMPLKKKGTNTFGGKGLTIIDSLDTLYLMQLNSEFIKAKQFVESDFKFEGRINVFENNIRVLGGLLGAYSLTKEDIFLTKAKMVGEILLGAFTQRIPCGVIDTHKPNWCGTQSWAHGKAVNAEVGTLSIEFVALSKFTGDQRWADKIMEINQYWKEHDQQLLQMHIDIPTEKMSGPATIGGGIDSTYEYFIKLKALTGDSLAAHLYSTFEEMIVKHMFVTYGSTTFARADGSDTVEHLACFLGGMLIMGKQYIEQGLAMTETCARMYTTNPSGIACDQVTIKHDGSILCQNDFYLLRPETVESIFYAWRETHDQKWRNYATRIWKAIQKHCQVDSGGFTDVRHVTSEHPQQTDKQESWFLAETLKYLWLIFQPDDTLSLEKYVFNTEAHPIFINNLS
jgi:mannosyl-oligosaccharide alpha-1,2-mannosidase